MLELTEMRPRKVTKNRVRVLGAANEVAMVERRPIIYLQRLGFGLTITDIRRLAFDFVQKNNIHGSLFNAAKKSAGWDWYRSFMHRHPEITVRKNGTKHFTCPYAVHEQAYGT